ncbi:TlpA family protein disulfide reductase [Roseibium sp. M-1]
MSIINRRQLLAAGALFSAFPLTTLAAEDELFRLGLIEPAFTIQPKLDLPDLSGKPHQIEDYSGRMLLVSFWATWCPPCRKEMPGLARLSRELGPEGFSVLAVNVGDSQDRIVRFLGEIDHDGMTFLSDPRNSMASVWYLHGLPVTYLLDRSGKVQRAAIGDRVWDSDDMLAALRSLGKV